MSENLGEEQISELKDYFSLFDKNGDQLVPTAQLGTLLRSIGLTPSEQEVKRLANEVDRDNSG